MGNKTFPCRCGKMDIEDLSTVERMSKLVNRNTKQGRAYCVVRCISCKDSFMCDVALSDKVLSDKEMNEKK